MERGDWGEVLESLEMLIIEEPHRWVVYFVELKVRMLYILFKKPKENVFLCQSREDCWAYTQT